MEKLSLQDGIENIDMVVASGTSKYRKECCVIALRDFIPNTNVISFHSDILWYKKERGAAFVK